MSKMTDIKLSEVSAVDWPAHLVTGFAVMKSADPDKNEALLSALRKEKMPDEKTSEEVIKTLSAEDIIKALSDEQRAEFEKAFGKKVAPKDQADGGEDDPDEDDVTKSMSEPIRKAFEAQAAEIAKRDTQIAEATAIAKAERETRLDAEVVTKSEKEYDNLGFDHAKVAPALRKFAAADSESAEAIGEMLKAVNAQADGAIFKTLGTDAESTAVTPIGRLDALAKARAEADGVTFSKAYATVVTENPDLVNAYYKENS